MSFLPVLLGVGGNRGYTLILGVPPNLLHLYINKTKKEEIKFSHFWRFAAPKTAPCGQNLKIAILKPSFHEKSNENMNFSSNVRDIA